MNKKNPKILNEFLNYLLTFKSYSLTTIESYNIDLLLFFEFIKKYLNLKIKIQDFNTFVLLQVKEADIIAFLIYCNNTRDNNAYTRKRKLAAIKCFYKWLFTTFPDGENHTNPTNDIRSVANTIRLPKYLTLEQSKKIQTVFNANNSKNYLRNNAIICLFLSTGVRVSELISINLSDINFTQKVIRIIGKGNKERIIYFSDYCKKQLESYLSKRTKREKNINLNQPLFLTNRNERFTRNGIYYICKQAFNYIDLKEKRYSPHTLRHTAATLIYTYVKQDTLLLKEFLGHESIASTQIYTHIHNQEIKEAVEKNPLSNLGLEDEKIDKVA